MGRRKEKPKTRQNDEKDDDGGRKPKRRKTTQTHTHTHTHTSRFLGRKRCVCVCVCVRGRMVGRIRMTIAAYNPISERPVCFAPRVSVRTSAVKAGTRRDSILDNRVVTSFWCWVRIDSWRGQFRSDPYSQILLQICTASPRFFSFVFSRPEACVWRMDSWLGRPAGLSRRTNDSPCWSCPYSSWQREQEEQEQVGEKARPAEPNAAGCVKDTTDRGWIAVNNHDSRCREREREARKRRTVSRINHSQARTYIHAHTNTTRANRQDSRGIKANTNTEREQESKEKQTRQQPQEPQEPPHPQVYRRSVSSHTHTHTQTHSQEFPNHNHQSRTHPQTRGDTNDNS